MASVSFPSLIHGKERAYTIHDSSYDLDSRGQHHHLADWAGMFETYGDGMVQHSHEFATPEEAFGDYCGSLATFILAGGKDAETAAEYLANVCWWNVANRPEVEFAQSVKYKEGKRTYYSKAERKTSTADSKRNDRRWEEVKEWMDGGLLATFRLCLPDFNLDFLSRYATADAVVDAYSYEHGWHGNAATLLDFSEVTKKQAHDEDWSQAFSALNSVRESYRSRKSGKSTLSCWMNNAIDNKRIREEATAE